MDARTIAIANQKGGTGKTAIAALALRASDGSSTMSALKYRDKTQRVPSSELQVDFPLVVNPQVAHARLLPFITHRGAQCGFIRR